MEVTVLDRFQYFIAAQIQFVLNLKRFLQTTGLKLEQTPPTVVQCDWFQTKNRAAFNPVTHGPMCPPLTRGPWADLPYKNRADLPEGHEFRATVIEVILWNTISIWNSNVITMEQLRNNLFA
jgi:hypothetical protein